MKRTSAPRSYAMPFVPCGSPRGCRENRSIIERKLAKVARRGRLSMRIPRILLLCLLLGVGLVWFCTGRAARANEGYSLTLREANEHKILLLTVGSEPRTLDPQEAQGVTEHH